MIKVEQKRSVVVCLLHPGGNYTCSLCSDGSPAAACVAPPPDAPPAIPKLPTVEYKWCGNTPCFSTSKSKY
jgi:hypothetical protein